MELGHKLKDIFEPAPEGLKLTLKQFGVIALGLAVIGIISGAFALITLLATDDIPIQPWDNTEDVEPVTMDWSPDGKKIAFTFDRTIYEVGTDGKGLTRISEDLAENDQGNAASPQYAPDGSGLYYSRYQTDQEPHRWDLVKATGKEGQTERLPSNAQQTRDKYNVWFSPDSTLIAHHGEPIGDEQDGIFLTSKDGSQTTELIRWPLNSNRQELMIAGWTPDGEALAFMEGSEKDGRFNLYTADRYTGRVTKVAENLVSFPAWKPDGSSVHYLTLRGKDPQLALYQNSPKGGQEEEIIRLSEAGQYYTPIGVPNELDSFGRRIEFQMEWSPNGEKLLISGKERTLAVYTPAKQELVGITPTEHTIITEEARFLAKWSPDGSTIALLHRATDGVSADAIKDAKILMIVDPGLREIETLARHKPNQAGFIYPSRLSNLYKVGKVVESDSLTPPIEVKPATYRIHRISRLATEEGKSPINLAGRCQETVDGQCTPRSVSNMNPILWGGEAGAGAGHIPTSTVEQVVEGGFFLSGASPIHLAVRGLIRPSSTRCHWRGTARTLDQRDKAIRFWLGITNSDPLPDREQLLQKFDRQLTGIDERFDNGVKEDFKALVNGGLNNHRQRLVCYADLNNVEYLLGTGEASLTISFETLQESRSYDLYQRSFNAGQFGTPSQQLHRSEGSHAAQRARILQEAETKLSEVLGNRQTVILLAPTGAQNTIAVESWQAVAQWDLQIVENEDEQGHTTTETYAFRYGAGENDPEYQQPLTRLQERITSAASSDAYAGERLTSSSAIQTYYRQLGAYGDITPDDGSTDTFIPAQPPAPYACAGATVITDSSAKPGLVHDCEALLAAKYVLQGTASLNWTTTLSLDDWNGVNTSGTPGRLTGLDLDGQGLSGTLPASLGSLYELTELDLRDNSLTGTIPEELSQLENLTSLRLSGNNLTGCIPLGLKKVPDHDLISLRLLYCKPKTPKGVTAGTPEEFTIPLSWTQVTNAARYEVQYRTGRSGDWTIYPDQPSEPSQQISGLGCSTKYQFRVRAYGNARIYAAAWSDTSVPATATTEECTN